MSFTSADRTHSAHLPATPVVYQEPPTPSNARVEKMVKAGEMSLLGEATNSRVSLKDRVPGFGSISEESQQGIELELTGRGEGAAAASTIRDVTGKIIGVIDDANKAVENAGKRFDEFGNEIGDAAEQIGDAVDQFGQTVERTVDRVQDVADRIQKRSWFQRLLSCCTTVPEEDQGNAGQQRQVTVQRNGATATGTLAPRPI